jgi:hypothetical protein
MTRGARRYRSWQYARRAQRLHLSQAHPDGAGDCVCEQSVWFFEKQQVSRHCHACFLCHPKYRQTSARARVKRYMARWGVGPPERFVTGG